MERKGKENLVFRAIEEDNWCKKIFIGLTIIPLVILHHTLLYILPFLIGIGLIWLFGWTYGFILASIVLILVYGGLFGLIAIYVLSFLYKFLLG